ncbi:helix-turn-helix transcriptional regulator [Effusibacillus pohliae]|uniref:helix-turn-helix transcriptional regulator n=1 Tax=Effusibacillus pohliae TaxID=232270 RepID=UPI00037E1B07|nr:helix-turn-helix transcriptional regulator [Effusibacillus pohliae]
MAVKSRLKVILVERRIKQYELAERIGVSKHQINRICNGVNPELETALKIARELNMSIHDIWELEG